MCRKQQALPVLSAQEKRVQPGEGGPLGDGSRQPPPPAPYPCPIAVPSYSGPRELPPTAPWEHWNRDLQPPPPQSILILGSPLSPLLPPASFCTACSEHTVSPGSGRGPGWCPPRGLSSCQGSVLPRRPAGDCHAGQQGNIDCLWARLGHPWNLRDSGSFSSRSTHSWVWLVKWPHRILFSDLPPHVQTLRNSVEARW